MRRYLETQYLTGNRLDPDKGHPLIAVKAQRLWELTQNTDQENWFAAECYVHTFYDAVLPAIYDADASAARQLADAVDVFEPAPAGTHLIVNAFEAAIAALFVPAGNALLAQITGNSTGQPPLVKAVSGA